MIHDYLLAHLILNELREDFTKKTGCVVFKIDHSNHLSASGVVRWKQKKFDQAWQTEAHITSIVDPIEQKWPGAVLVGAHMMRERRTMLTRSGGI